MDPLFQILKRLIDFNVPFVLIGGMAARIHGSHLPTEDVDVCIPTDDATMDKVHAALQAINPRYRFRPDRMRMHDEPVRLHGMKNLNLETDLGVIDLLGEVSGIGKYDEAFAKSRVTTIFGMTMRILDLNALIASKSAAGRTKDKLGVMHLQAVKKEIEKDQPPPRDESAG
jgi:hypothetical protein